MRSLVLALVWVVSTPAAAEEISAAPIHATIDDDQAWPRTTNARGGRGGLTLDAAHPLRTHAFVLQVRSELAYATSIFEAHDNDLYNLEQFSAVWAPVRGLEVGLSGSLQINTWRRFVNSEVTLLSDPMLRVKYSMLQGTRWGFGGVFAWLVPPRISDASLDFAASTVSIAGLASFAPVPHLELTGNIGLVWDRSDQLGTDVDPDKRFVYQVNQGSGVSLGVGALEEFAITPGWALTPFVEVSGLIKHTSSWTGNPWLATIGVKSYFLPTSLFEFMLGMRLRLTGAPQAQGDYPGLFPWTGFIGITVHIFDEPPQVVAGTPCNDSNDCPPGQQCIDDTCHYVTEVIKQVTRVEKEKTFLVAGTVLDTDTLRPVDGAEITFTGFEHTPVAIDQKSGSYTSFPLKCGEGMLEMHVKAPSYKTFTYAFARAAPNQVTNVAVKLRRAERPDIGRVEGNIKDNRTGRPVPRAKLVIITLGLTIPAGDTGQFSRDVPVGHHDVLISAPGYITQRKKVIVHDADVVILNIDLAPARRKHKPIPGNEP